MNESAQRLHDQEQADREKQSQPTLDTQWRLVEYQALMNEKARLDDLKVGGARP